MKRFTICLECTRAYTLLVLMLSLLALYFCYSWIVRAQHSFHWADFIGSGAGSLFIIQEGMSNTNMS